MFSLLLSLVTNAMVENYSRAVGHGETLLKYLYQGENNYKLLKKYIGLHQQTLDNHFDFLNQ
jgi:hypothetical protein